MYNHQVRTVGERKLAERTDCRRELLVAVFSSLISVFQLFGQTTRGEASHLEKAKALV